MSKAIVFGGSGFLGSHVADELSEQGIAVTIFDVKKSSYLRADQKMICGDICSLSDVENAVVGQDYVLNFAGMADIQESFDRPIQATQINILGNLNILEAIKVHVPKRYVFASSYYVYSTAGSIYRVTKQACELFIEEYAKNYNLDFLILRFGSLYGPRSDQNNAVYRFVSDALLNKKILRQGDGEEVREYIHVEDAAKATYETMSRDYFKNKHVILAGSQKIKVKELLEMIKEMMENKIEIEYLPAQSTIMGHYSLTPYTFKPQMAVRYKRETFYDLGQGILQMMYALNGHNITLKDSADIKRLDV